MSDITVPNAPQVVAPTRRDDAELDLFAARLADWLRSVMPGAHGLTISDLSYPHGTGQSHETILFTCRWIDGLPHERGLVVRLKPTSFTVFGTDMFSEQIAIMRALHRDGTIPVAEVLWQEDDPSILGAPFFVMEQLTGRVPVSIPSYMITGWLVDSTSAQRATAWESGVRTLGLLQTIPLETFDFLAPSGQDGWADEWERWERFLFDMERRRPLPFHRAVHERLSATMPEDRSPGLVWGDARLGNMLFDDRYQVAAVMDWEQPSLGGSLHDLGWWLFIDRLKHDECDGRVPTGLGDAADTIALWREVTRRSTQDIGWYEAFAGLKIACLGINMMDMRGQRPPDGDYTALPNSRALAEVMAQLGH